jgi:hypothetical protein
MVHLRLRQWAEVSTSFHDYADQFEHPLDRLYEQAQVPQPTWGALPGSPRRRATVARELAASAARFNRRWAEYVNQLDFRPINRVIEHYNAYYTLEKECSLGSTRLATRYFKAVEPITVDSILRTHPFLDEPKMRRA